MPGDQTVDDAPLTPQAGDSTSTLLERARAGDAVAVDALFARCLPPLMRWARGKLPRYARDAADTQDVVQEAMLQTFKHLETFEARGEGALLAYLRQAVSNRVRDHIRRVTRRPEATTLDSHQQDDGPTPHEHVVALEAFERYEHALAKLSEVDRMLIVLSIEFDLDFGEIAAATGRASADAARRAARRALIKLAEEMRHE